MSPVLQTIFLVWTFFAVSYSKLALVPILQMTAIQSFFVNLGQISGYQCYYEENAETI